MTDFQPRGWEEVADALAAPLSGPSVEACLRASVNRYYYAALMSIARRVIDERGTNPFVGTADTHHRVKKGLRLHKRIPQIRRMRDELGILEDLRDRADYVLARECTQKDVDEAKERGKRLIGLIYGLKASYFRSLPVD